MREFKLQKIKKITMRQSRNTQTNCKVFNLFDKNFADSIIVDNILVTMSERCEASITLLENAKDLSKITLTEVLHAF